MSIYCLFSCVDLFVICNCFVFIYYILYRVDGVIPSELCGVPGLELDVSDTDIQCYSCCLTSSKVLLMVATMAR